MKKELQDELFKKYPKIFRQKDLPKQETAMCWGISCGDGWYTLLDELCGDIKNHIQNVNRNNPDAEPLVCEAVQVKEKFGSLRFYTQGGDDYTNGLIGFAESISSHICSECGNKCTQKNIRGWIHSMCPDCQDKHLSRRKNEQV
tara:strand:+ start:275 stop:706 length:432 start_codon:yes stop_codon:yes gene_type:complete